MGPQRPERPADNGRAMTNLRLVAFLLFLPLTFTSAACPTRTIPVDGGDGGSSGTDGGAGTTGAAGAIGGRGGAGGGPGGATGSPGGAGGKSATGGGSGAHGGAGGISSTGTGGSLATGGTPGTGGSVSTGGTSGTGGTSSQAGAGGTGTGGMGAAGGATTCTNTSTDALNCGTCGHSCLGGACTGAICQPLLLGTVPITTDYAHGTVVSGGNIYVLTSVGNPQNFPTKVWKGDATKPGDLVSMTTNGTASCIMNGQLFWTTYVSPPGISSCSVSNCAATTAPIVTLSSGSFFGGPLGCDSANNELVWTSTPDNISYTVNRASPSGAKARAITSFTLADNYWKMVDNGAFPGETDRIFYVHNDFASGSASLYYIATNVVNAASVMLIGIPNSQIATGGDFAWQSVIANDAIVLASEYLPQTTSDQIVGVPLPNGILSGAPPVFTAGKIYGGVMDQTTFYGTISANSAVPSDAIVKCPLSNCDAPTVVTRGQANATYFTNDATAIYWITTTQTTTQGFSIWKAAK
jgi:hypothetical protein